MWVGVDSEGDFDQQALAGLGHSTWGDFDQLSLEGVDFGEDYCQDYNVEPTNLKGDYSMYGYSQQLGADYDQLGIMPEGLGSDYQQMGVVPAGLGLMPSGLGHSHYTQMGNYVPTNLDFKTWTNTQWAGVAAISVGILYAARKMGYIKQKLPLIG